MQHIKNWWQAIRFHFTFPTFLPVLLGTEYALLETEQCNILSFFAVLFATICHHIGLNLADDYYDYCHGTDLFKETGKNIYAGGSGVLLSGKIKPSIIKMVAIFCYCITAIIGLLLSYIHGYLVLALGIFGIFCSFYYTAPPLKFAYRGFGELAIWLNFGPILVLGSYYVQTHTVSIGAILLSILMGTSIFCLIIANEIPDQATDKAAAKNTLIVLFGKKFGILAIIFSIMLIFSILLTAIIIDIFPPILITSFLSIPIAYYGIKTLTNTMNTNNIHGNEFIVGFCNILGIILICSFGFILFKSNHLMLTSIMLATVVLFYIPIALFTPKSVA